MASDKLIIGYAGSLNYFDGREPRSNIFERLKNYFWTYRVDNVNNNTRSAYFLFKGIQVLKEKYPDSITKIELQLWGLIDHRNKQQAEELGINNIVKIEGYYSKQQSLEKLMNCDVLFLPLETSKNGQIPLFIPGKIFDYLHQNKPILALSEKDSHASKILIDSGVSAIVNPYDSMAVAEQLQYLIINKNKLPELFVPDSGFIDLFSFDNKTKQLAKIFDELDAE